MGSVHAGGRPLLRGVTFRVERGERIALTGPNGSGKSTLLRAILGEVAPVAGSARLAGSTVSGYLPQDDAMDIFAGESAGITPLEWIRREAALSEGEAGNELHRYLGSHEALSTPIGRLSYGERRRLALARLIIRGANLLLLDEPTNHLDLPAREEFEDVLAGFDGAVIAASHDRYFVEQWAQRVIHLEDGAMVEH
ncbi:MAG: ATP-binding cassette domain-containing protein [Dehalococcoidia bacterium]|nr:ATP-binding cassette domain-containing protein [Dehalococcoidia bacterium]